MKVVYEAAEFLSGAMGITLSGLTVVTPSGLTAFTLSGLTALALAGCSAPGSLADRPSATVSPIFVSDVDGPFDVRDADGRSYQHPFLGGFNVPRPQLLDIDGDGDVDLFVQEEPNAVMFFENVGAGTASAGPAGEAFRFRTRKYAGIDVGEWYRYVDLDGDGLPDLLTEQPFSYVRYLRNSGERGKPAFIEAADSLRDASGDPIFSDRQNIPNVVDIDCDGKPDLFIGRLEGTISRYEWVGVTGGVPRFVLVEDRFQGIEIIGQVVGSRHGANTLAFADVDGDGDEDLLWGDYFEPGLLLIENTGSCARIGFGAEPAPFPPNDPIRTSGYNAPATGDIDGDSDIDLLIGVLGGAFNANATTADNLIHLEQADSGEFLVRSTRFINTVDVGAESIAAVGDIDNDGNPDLLLANQIEPHDSQTSGIYLFTMRQEGDERFWQLTDTIRFDAAYHYAPALGDLDGDGDLDVVLGTWRDELRWYRNESAGGELKLEPAGVVARLSRGSNATPALVDIDGDGDLDLFVGETSGTINFFRNVGSASKPRFERVSDEYAGIDAGRRSFPVFEDLDGDGDYDLVLGRDDRSLLVYRNDGTPSGALFRAVEVGDAGGIFEALLRLEVPVLATPVFFDLDGDRDRDLVSGGEGGGVVYLERR